MRISDWSSDVCSSDLLPAYVLVKVLTPGFYARKDTKTPVKTAVVVLVVNVALNFILIAYFGVVGLAIATAICAWLHCAMLYAILKIGRASCRERVCQYV